MLLGMQQILFWLSQVSENPNPNPNPSDEWHCYVWGSGHAYSVADMANLNYHINLRFFFVFVRWENCGAMLKLACVSCVFFKGCVWRLFWLRPDFFTKWRSNILDLAPGLSVIIHAILTSRCIFQRMKNYTIYAVSITVRIVLGFLLLTLIWRFDFSPFMVLIIAILNDGTIMTISKACESHIVHTQNIYIYIYMRNKCTIFPVLIGRCMSCESLVLMACLIVHYYQESRT